MLHHYIIFFFFQAEDGIRDSSVTGVQTCALPISHGAVHGEDTALPRRMEHRLIRLGLDLAEAVHAAHVMDPIHGAPPGAPARPVPIMESRRTSLASFSSLHSSGPARRIATTRY